MHGARRLSPAGRLVVAIVAALVAAGVLGSGSLPATAVAGIPRWTGGVDLYRSSAFTTQKTWLWCTAADVQIIRNLADHQADHLRSSQQRYFDAMRAHNRYDIPVSDGVDPAGWAYGLRHFVDSRYRLVSSGSFDAALRSAVTNLRKTNLPVGITVAHGDHAWVLTGFTATADPARTSRFTVTSVRVVGPLWGLQSRTYGYDMRPDMKLTPKQLAGFFTPWHYARIRMAWEGRWVSIQPIAATRVSAVPRVTPNPTPKPTRTAAASAGSAASAPSAGPSSIADPTPGEVAVAADPVDPGRAANPATAPTADVVNGESTSATAPPGIVAVVSIVVLAAIVLIMFRTLRRRRG